MMILSGGLTPLRPAEQPFRNASDVSHGRTTHLIVTFPNRLFGGVGNLTTQPIIQSDFPIISVEVPDQQSSTTKIISFLWLVQIVLSDSTLNSTFFILCLFLLPWEMIMQVGGGLGGVTFAYWLLYHSLLKRQPITNTNTNTNTNAKTITNTNTNANTTISTSGCSTTPCSRGTKVQNQAAFGNFLSFWKP